MTRVAVLLAALVACGCRPDCTPPPGETRPNVVVVTIDTLRADHVGAYGSRTARTPALDRLAKEGVLFTESYSQTHLTLPSHATIFSSLPTARHGVTTNLTAPPREIAPLLPRLFRDAGWETVAFVSAKHLGRAGPFSVAFGDAFGKYRSTEDWHRTLTADRTTDRFVRWVHGACRTPFFAWVHLFDPHMPYTPPAPFDRAYYAGDPTAARYPGLDGVQLTWMLHDLDRLRPTLARHAAAVRALRGEFGLAGRWVDALVLRPLALEAYAGQRAPALRAGLDTLRAAVRRELPFNPHLAEFLAGVRDPAFPPAQYAGEVSFVDQQVGRLADELTRLGLDGRTILVVTGDHGEALGEHGIYWDHHGLYEPTVRVPLIVRAPRLAPARRTDLVAAVDVAPTVLALAGLPVPPAMTGRDLFGSVRDAPAVFAEADDRRQIMIRDGRWKLIRTLETFYYNDAFAPAAGTVELYDVIADPDERVDAATREPDVARELDARLMAWNAAQIADRPVPVRVAPEVERGLRALGYVD